MARWLNGSLIYEWISVAGWMDGWMDGWIDEWMDGWTDGMNE